MHAWMYVSINASKNVQMQPLNVDPAESIESVKVQLQVSKLRLLLPLSASFLKVIYPNREIREGKALALLI
jgi:hypothetical protein